MTLFECENLTLGYGGNAVAEHLTFRVERGDYLCVIGENGSGKSTLIKTLLGLNKPLAGRIEAHEEFAPGRIGYMPQQTRLQRDFPASVREVVLSGRLGGKRGFGIYSRTDYDAARNSLQRLGIADLENRALRELSGGQQQRVLLARALCAAKDVLLADEPCAGLDAQSTAGLYALIDELNRKDGMTVIMVTHDLEAAETYANKILHLGKNRFFCTREQYLAFRAAGGKANTQENAQENTQENTQEKEG